MGVEVVSGGVVEAAAPAKEVSVAKVEAVAPGAAAVAKNTSFREESNRLGDLKDGERKALAELRAKVEEAIVEGKLFEEESSSKVKAKVEVKVEKKKKEEDKKKKTKKAEAAKEKKEEAAVEKEEAASSEEKKEEETKEEATTTSKVKAAKEKVEGKKKKEKKEGKKKKEKAAEEKKEEVKEEEAAATEEKKTEEEAKKEVAAANEEKKTEEEAKKEVAAAAEDKKADEEAKEEAATTEEKKEETDAEEKKEEEAATTEDAGEAEKKEAVVVDRDATLWGVPLLPSKGNEATDVVLLKFLRARDFKAGAAFEMLRKTLRWRREWKSLAATAADDGAMPEGACRLDGADREGHPVCYSALGVLADDAVYRAALGDDEGKARFLRWRVRAMESHVAELDFRPGGVASLLQVTDLKNSPGPSKKDFRVAIRQVVDLFQDNYPELVARNILINVPLSYYAFSTLFYPLLTQRTRSKFVIARPSKVTETLLKYIPIESIPVKYGGLKRDGDTEFSAEDAEITEVIVKASSTETIEIEATEGDTTLTWDLTVLGWEVSYKEEFVPSDEGSYTIVVSKGRKMGTAEEAVRNSFRAGEPGKVVITVENATRGKKKVLFRHKAKSSSAKKC